MPDAKIKAQRIDGGLRLKLNKAGTHYVDPLSFMWGNWRIVESPAIQGDNPLTYERGWCYFGCNGGLGKALAAAWAWDGSPDTEPEGYDKAMQ